MARPLALALLLLAVAAAGAPAHASAASSDAWRPDMERATDYAEQRAGAVSFGVVDESGKLWVRHGRRTVPAASVFKVMLMVTYLRQRSVRDRRLRSRDRELLEPMIRWSDNDTATRVREIVGRRAINRLARRAEMRDFELDPRTWGLSRTSARDQARFVYRLDSYVPLRHRGYARELLRTIVASQRWGIAAVAPTDWTLYFKGGWGSATGRVCHQVAFLERGDRRVAVAIMTERSPSHRYATRTLRGVAGRLLRGLGEQP